ncbi:heavy-metal-associated domain-containing protein [Candidatus Woesearchaeota archaeon]|nr:heavy-metal-associated domain-containing protein [Candidatus Woesearchaeota archaeon]
MINKKFKVKGMHCKSCEFLIKDVLSDFAVEAKADLNKKEVLLNFDENKISLNKIKEILKKYKYEIVA